MSEKTPQWVALFPGQGAQAVGMGRELAETWPEAARVFEQADEALGEKLSTLCFEGPEQDLRLTANTQPALLTVAVAAWTVMASRIPAPLAGAGHSLGEYSALVASGVIAFDDAVRAVRLRGEAMQAAVPVGVGAMAAVIGLEESDIESLCQQSRQAGEVLVPANFNAPGQVVVAGHRSAVERLIERAPAAGAKRAIPLPVSAPFHCPLMTPAAERLAEFLQTFDFRPGAFPVVCNVDAQPCQGGDLARERLVSQVASPVLWIDTMRRLEDDFGAELGLEFGVGRVLAGLSRKINQNLRVASFSTAADLEKVLSRF